MRTPFSHNIRFVESMLCRMPKFEERERKKHVNNIEIGRTNLHVCMWAIKRYQFFFDFKSNVTGDADSNIRLSWSWEWKIPAHYDHDD